MLSDDTGRHDLRGIFAAGLLLKVYQERPEAEQFRADRTKLLENLQDHAREIPRVAAELREYFPPNSFGTSRETSIETLSNWSVSILSLGISSSIRLSFNRQIREILQDNIIRQVFFSACEFGQQYNQYQTNPKLGGVWFPKKRSISKFIIQSYRGINASKLLVNQIVLRYSQGDCVKLPSIKLRREGRL